MACTHTLRGKIFLLGINAICLVVIVTSGVVVLLGSRRTIAKCFITDASEKARCTYKYAVDVYPHGWTGVWTSKNFSTTIAVSALSTALRCTSLNIQSWHACSYVSKESPPLVVLYIRWFARYRLHFAIVLAVSLMLYIVGVILWTRRIFKKPAKEPDLSMKNKHADDIFNAAAPIATVPATESSSQSTDKLKNTKATPIASEPEQAWVCWVCESPDQNRPTSLLSCGHILHTDCADSSFQDGFVKCPTCSSERQPTDELKNVGTAPPSSESEQAWVCWICGNPDQNRPTSLLPCGHVLHTDCADSSFQAGSVNCPTCDHPMAGEPAAATDQLDAASAPAAVPASDF